MLKHALTFWVLAFLLQGCASLRSVPVVPDAADSVSDGSASPPGWHSVAFNIAWPENQAPTWHVDTYLAHGICQNILDTHRGEMVLWRFHRRALRDPAGHRFSFKFYGDTTLAETVYGEIGNHPQTRQLLAAGILSSISYAPLAGNERPDLADTSDPRWPPPMRASWPYFAMGMSQSWLALIDQVVQASSPASHPETLGERLAFYESVNDQVTEYWRDKGAHAYLHHLNALFGYEEVIIKGKRATRF